MARIFTTSFEFNHSSHDAIVAITEIAGKVNYRIKLLDDTLMAFIPNGEIVYSGSYGFETQEIFNNTVAQSLLRQLHGAISTHLVIGG